MSAPAVCTPRAAGDTPANRISLPADPPPAGGRPIFTHCSIIAARVSRCSRNGGISVQVPPPWRVRPTLSTPCLWAYPRICHLAPSVCFGWFEAGYWHGAPTNIKFGPNLGPPWTPHQNARIAIFSGATFLLVASSGRCCGKLLLLQRKQIALVRSGSSKPNSGHPVQCVSAEVGIRTAISSRGSDLA